MDRRPTTAMILILKTVYSTVIVCAGFESNARWGRPVDDSRLGFLVDGELLLFNLLFACLYWLSSIYAAVRCVHSGRIDPSIADFICFLGWCTVAVVFSASA